MKPQKQLVLITLLFMAALILGAVVIDNITLPSGILIEAEGQPTLGNKKAAVHVIVFEEPKCPFCKEYTEEIFPKLKANYIDNDKIAYTTIMVSFLPRSMKGAVGLMCAYYANPDQPNSDHFYNYLTSLYANQGDEEDDYLKVPLLLKIAQEVNPKMDLAWVENCIVHEKFREQIEKNTHYGRQIMGGTLVTPALFVNGIAVDNLTYKKISNLIERIIQKNSLQKHD